MTEDEKAFALTMATATQLSKAVYSDVAASSMKTFGDQLALAPRFLQALLRPMHRRLEESEAAYRQFQEDLRKRYDAIPEERRTEAPPELASAVLQKVTYVAEEPELREMYAQLLASSMDAATSSGVHRSFVHVIEQLSPQDARVLVALSKNVGFVVGESGADWHAVRTKIDATFRKTYLPEGDLGQARFCMDNLVRLRLLEIDVRTSSQLQHPRGIVQRGRTISGEYEMRNSIHGQATVTQYGRRFMRACVGQADEE